MRNARLCLDEDNIKETFDGILAELSSHRPSANLLHCASLATFASPRIDGRSVTTHRGEGHELIFMLDGTMRMATATGMVDLTPGCLLLVEPRAEHGEVPEIRYTLVWCQAHGRNVHLNYEVNSRGLHGVILIGSTDLTYIFAALSREFAGRDSDTEESVRSLLQHLCCLLHRRLSRGSYVPLPQIGSDLSAEHWRWNLIEAILQYCAAHFSTRVRLSEIAQAVGYSEAHISRVFQKHVGKPISDYLQDLRMARAKDLLIHSDLSIASIAQEVGYTDHSNFKRAFIRTVGFTPKAYRAGNRSAQRARAGGASSYRAAQDESEEATSAPPPVRQEQTPPLVLKSARRRPALWTGHSPL